MKRYLHHLFLICLFLFNSNAILSAQECATDELHHRMMSFSDIYREDMETLQKWTTAYQNSSESENQRTAPCAPDKMNTIPVVVHVIHLGENIGSGSNISDQQIINAINAANDRFRSNSGQSLDMDIQLVLAKRDPDGNPTNGINRVNGSNLDSYVTNGIIMEGETGSNAIEVKSLSIWPRNKYYNIWVLHKISGGWAGFAQFPTTYQYEGTHMDYRYMTASGVTLTHEIGHAMNLQHTFDGDNNGNSCPGNGVCELQGDFVCDTPPHRRGDCGTISSCGNPSVPFTNSSRNIMSYCSTRIHFTDGQRNRMKAALKIFNRTSLLNSEALIPVEMKTDLALTNLSVNQDNNCFEKSMNITFTNHGSENITHALLRLKSSSDIIYFPYTGNISSGESIDWTTPELQIASGQHNLLLEIIKVNDLFSDDNAENNFFCGTYDFMEEINHEVCYNFENNSIPEGMVFSKNGVVTTSIQDVTGCTDKGQKAITYSQWNVVPANNYSDIITLPSFSFDDADGSAFIYDRSYAKMNNGMNYSTLLIEASEDCGNSYNTLKSMNGNDLATTSRILPNAKFSPRDCNEWKRDTIHFDSPNSQMLRFRIDKTSGQKDQNIYLDNLCFVKKYSVLVQYNIEEGTVSGERLYLNGEFATLSASPLPGYTFAGWFEGDELISENELLTFNVQSKRNLTARFYGIPTAIKQNTAFSANIYPNPAQDIIHIHLKAQSNPKLQIQITDLQGRVHFSAFHSVSSNEATIPVSIKGMSSGLYLINIYSSEGSSTYKLTVIE